LFAYTSVSVESKGLMFVAVFFGIGSLNAEFPERYISIVGNKVKRKNRGSLGFSGYCVAPTALAPFGIDFPAPTGWANAFHNYDAG